ncbi:MAG TPA: TaqI-like C-terminal specificity domain-containing protein [Acidiferrobacterales bacterium]|nr:TaqI-like C-terminal specificity domain-containing protein [Acidiferrobacterales bacterium]
MTAPREILDLVENFDQHVEDYRKGSLNETQLRVSFLNPFLKALGWDVDNTQGHAEAYREVVHEDQVKIGGNTKSPDYSCRVGGTRKFFVEAKKPSVVIKDEPAPAFQLRRYAWSAKLPLSILTDFEEFAVYDCRIRPGKDDKAAVARIHYWTYRDYAEKWDEIAAIFSKEAVLKGSFDKYAATAKGKKGTSEVDSAFLDEIEGWREHLAKDIARNNEELSQRALNWSVQQTIDRIVFLRIAEDRGIEPEQLRALQNGTNVYARLKELFQKADDRYNSGLFHFKKEPDRLEEPDRLTPGLVIDDKTLKDIFKHLYYPDSPYEFSVLGADILGSVYERFLGKVIRLTEGHHAKIEEKPEVKKAGGVFYTPTYIVDYIVKHTVGKLLEGKTPKEAEKLRILDPACGSGSFLIGAYQCLLDWHRDWYVNDGAEKCSKGKNPKLWLGRGKEWRLTTTERKRILVNNIYGVDIDSQAVEVTKLSLLLKVLEGESDQTPQSALFHERVLPDLGSNIKCGNSLIGSEFYQTDLFGQLSDEEIVRVNAFDWDKEFPAIIKTGGFDAVIGNPPYGASLTDEAKNYLSHMYAFVSDFETSQYFIARSHPLVRNGGHVSFIVPNTLFLNMYAQGFRHFIATSFCIDQISDLSRIDVFKGATVRTAIPFMRKLHDDNHIVQFVRFDTESSTSVLGQEVQSELVKVDNNWVKVIGGANTTLDNKIAAITVPLNEILEVSQGLIPYDKYRGHDEYTIKNRIWHADHKKDKTYKPELRGGDVTRYTVTWNRKQWISYGPWLAAPRKQKYFTEPRLLFREITDPKTGLLHVGFSDKEYYNNPGIINCILRETKYSLYYVLGVANSRLIAYLHFSSSPKARKGVFPKILVNDVRMIPIRRIDFDSPADRAQHDKMVSYVEKMLSLKMQLAAASTPHEQENLKRQIDATDRQIDKLVYELYGLTDEEIRIVEGAT